MTATDELEIVLAIYTTDRGFGWAVFEGRHSLIDWGVKEVRGDKNRQSLAKASNLLLWYKPDILVLENPFADGGRRSTRIKQLHRQLTELAESCKVQTKQISRSDIKAVFELRSAKSRYDIALAIAEELPPLAPWLPPPRKIWLGENPRLSIFDAAALAISFFEIGTLADHRKRPSA